jgi:hypothetical protein
MEKDLEMLQILREKLESKYPTADLEILGPEPNPELQEYWDRMRTDPRSIDELISTALTESDEDVVWNAVCALHFRGTEDCLARAEILCRSDSAKERCLGANILGQLGIPDRTSPRQCLSILLGKR